MDPQLERGGGSEQVVDGGSATVEANGLLWTSEHGIGCHILLVPLPVVVRRHDVGWSQHHLICTGQGDTNEVESTSLDVGKI